VQYGAEVKGSARSAVLMKYPEFEQDSDDEEDEEEEDEDEDGPIKLPKLITKETVLAVLKPNGVRFLLFLHPLYFRRPDPFLSCPQTEQVSINVNLVEDVEVVEFSVTGEKCVLSSPFQRSSF
jgi:FK506-binding nuclear protein